MIAPAPAAVPILATSPFTPLPSMVSVTSPSISRSLPLSVIRSNASVKPAFRSTRPALSTLFTMPRSSDAGRNDDAFAELKVDDGRRDEPILYLIAF